PRLSAGSVKFAHVIEIPAPPDRAFSFLLDLPRVARCLPGASDLRAGDHDRYLGDLRVDIGPFHLTLAGDVTILSRDEPTRTVTLRAVGDDPRAGGIRAAITMRAQHSGAGTRLLLDSDVQVVGRLARLGRLLVKRKADQLIAGFARNVARALGAPGETVENAFLILRLDGWRVLARLAVRFDSKARPHPEVVMLTSQRSGFSGVEE